jgi:hypothetical protein
MRPPGVPVIGNVGRFSLSRRALGACGLVLLGALSVSPSWGSGVRLASLGGETRLLLDTTNLFTYPSLASRFPHVAVELFDDWAGVAYPLSPGHTVGVFFNRPTEPLDRLSDYLRQTGSAQFRRLEPRPWVDVVYAVDLSPGLTLGVGGRLDYDVADTDSEASSSAATLRFGVSLGEVLGEGDGKGVDATIGLRRERLKDTSAAGATIRETDGNGFDFELRGRVPLGDGTTLLPFVSYSSSAVALAPARRDLQSVMVGLGANIEPAPGALAVAGIFASYTSLEEESVGVPRSEETALRAPVVVVASETQVGAMLFRLGIRHESTLTKRELADNMTAREFDSSLRVDLGLGLEFGPVLLDGLLEKDFLRDGPHVIGGSRHGGGIFSRVSLVYRFTN